jgi:AraC family transcriptional regulator
MLDIRVKRVERVVFKSDVVAIGTFRCPASDPMFRDSGPSTHHTFVFPRTSTIIRHNGGRAFTAGPNCVTLYNQGQEYTRTKIAAVDACDWYVVADDILSAAADLDHGRPFRETHVPADSRMYLRQRELFESLDDVDAFEVEDTVLSLLARVLAAQRCSPLTRRVRDGVEHAKRDIASAPSRRTTLRELAAATGLSPFHLCRAFRAEAGMSLSTYRHELRLRMSLELLRDVNPDLSDIALRLGFTSHSHFTAAFRRRFGMTPSQYRARS